MKKLKANVAKLQLNPGDIVVVTLPRQKGPHNCREVGEAVRAALRVPVRVVVMGEGCRIEGRTAQQLADLLTPEELYQATERINARLLAEPGAGLPMQRHEEISGATFKPAPKKKNQ